MSKLGKRLISSANEALAIAKGEMEPAGTHVFERADVTSIRKSLGLSQDKFATKFRISVATVRDWEHGRRQPDTAANNYLLMIKYAPDTVEKVMGGSGW